MNKNQMDKAVIFRLDHSGSVSAYLELTNKVNEFADLYLEITGKLLDNNAYKAVCQENFIEIENAFEADVEKVLSAIPNFGGMREVHRQKLVDALGRLRSGFDSLLSGREEIIIRSRSYLCLFFEEIRIEKGYAIWTKDDSLRIQRKYFTVYASDETQKIEKLSGKINESFRELFNILTGGSLPYYPGMPYYNFFNPEPGILIDGLLHVSDEGQIKVDWTRLWKPAGEYLHD